MLSSDEQRALRSGGRWALRLFKPTPGSSIAESFRRDSEDLRVIERVIATMPPGRDAHYDRMTLRRIKRDPMFRMYQRRITRPSMIVRRPCARPRGAGRPRAQATRSSARSGDGPSDSGEDGLGEPSPAEQLAALHALDDASYSAWCRALRERIEAEREQVAP